MKCHNHNEYNHDEYEATFKVTYGKYMDNVYFLCELCLIDYEDTLKNLDVPYRIEAIPEKVTFT